MPGLPGPPHSSTEGWVEEEKIGWRDLLGQAGSVRGGCEGGMGYSLLGESWGVVVTLWGTGGSWDRAVGEQEVVEDGPLAMSGTEEAGSAPSVVAVL